ncbi:MAG: 23S rRNA (guanosine(2251)-2'-O)-methyltransferase RlmB [Deltaproteobacteria bacterium]|nr:23S rRNA (guanosine(2251)-2'-O)-methyltransferase RlmB [Deltaproteobacteria bacterium]
MSSRLILSGLRSIEECLRANPDRIAKLLVPAGKLSPRLEELRALAQKKGIRIEANPKADPEEPLLAVMHDYRYADFDELVGDLKATIGEGERPVVLALDGITDAHNLGAILRTAAFMGVAAVVLPKDRSAAITDTVYRIASGGIEYLRVAQVTNLVSALRELKDAGFWSVGFSEHAEQDLAALKPDFPAVLVIGNEEKGMRQLVKENCDHLVRLAGAGGLHSLNASVAAALAMSWATELL